MPGFRNFSIEWFITMACFKRYRKSEVNLCSLTYPFTKYTVHCVGGAQMTNDFREIHRDAPAVNPHVMRLEQSLFHVRSLSSLPTILPQWSSFVQLFRVLWNTLPCTRSPSDPCTSNPCYSNYVWSYCSAIFSQPQFCHTPSDPSSEFNPSPQVSAVPIRVRKRTFSPRGVKFY